MAHDAANPLVGNVSRTNDTFLDAFRRVAPGLKACLDRNTDREWCLVPLGWQWSTAGHMTVLCVHRDGWAVFFDPMQNNQLIDWITLPEVATHIGLAYTPFVIEMTPPLQTLLPQAYGSIGPHA